MPRQNALLVVITSLIRLLKRFFRKVQLTYTEKLQKPLLKRFLICQFMKAAFDLFSGLHILTVTSHILSSDQWGLRMQVTT